MVVSTLEEADVMAGHFDLAVAATAVHWVDQELGPGKLGQSFRPGGWLAL